MRCGMIIGRRSRSVIKPNRRFQKEILFNLGHELIINEIEDACITIGAKIPAGDEEGAWKIHQSMTFNLVAVEDVRDLNHATVVHQVGVFTIAKDRNVILEAGGVVRNKGGIDVASPHQGFTSGGQ